MSKCRCGDFRDVPRTWPEVKVRLADVASVRPTLELLATNGETWMATYRCRVCGRLWASERPYSGAHGGGPEVLYQIEVGDAADWLQHAAPFVEHMRLLEEDERFFDALGPDIGPETCREPGCTHKRINPGMFCRCHHFEMVMHRPCPFWHREAAG